MECSGWRAVEPYPWGSILKFSMDANGTVQAGPTTPGCPTGTPAFIRTVHEKAGTNGAYSLVMTSTYEHICRFNRTFELRDNDRKATTGIPGATWADWGSRGRLVYARDGKIFAAGPSFEDGLISTTLADFNASKPRPTKSPNWAREW